MRVYWLTHLVDLIENGYEVISVDNNSRSNAIILKGVEKITGKKIKNYKVDLCNFDDTFAIFQENKDIIGIIHFAAYKAVGESVRKPLMYFENNLQSLINLLKCVQEFKILILFSLHPVPYMAILMKFRLRNKRRSNQQNHLTVIPSRWVSKSSMSL